MIVCLRVHLFRWLTYFDKKYHVLLVDKSGTNCEYGKTMLVAPEDRGTSFVKL